MLAIAVYVVSFAVVIAVEAYVVVFVVGSVRAVRDRARRGTLTLAESALFGSALAWTLLLLEGIVSLVTGRGVTGWIAYSPVGSFVLVNVLFIAVRARRPSPGRPRCAGPDDAQTPPSRSAR